MTLEDEIRQIVLARLETLPEDTGMSIGFAGELTRAHQSCEEWGYDWTDNYRCRDAISASSQNRCFL